MRSRDKGRFTTTERTRVIPSNPTRSVRSLGLRQFLTFNPPVSPILIIDRREYHPDGLFRPAASLNRSSRAIVYKAPKTPVGNYKFKGFSPTTTFREPSKVDVCQKRKTRREVLFAKGKGGGRVRKGKRNYLSNFHC